MTIVFPAPQALPNDGFRLLRVDFPGRSHPEHGDLPFWTDPADSPTDRADSPTDRADRGGDR
ncbi:hypothetical protein GPX89_23675 [Nocardia sp. ET3-3]|uniref:Alpha/beta hydrolase n=1 Tax=Nocardia terrae TaxID=2675851 RepID=A0A7K1V0S1_9NOCA|nr:hypothetical protein [Nocardia terrae]MVU80233.1 hypothetical protein [Nocardia terrae]